MRSGRFGAPLRRDAELARLLAGWAPVAHSNGASHVTPCTRSEPSICGIARACSTRSAGSTVTGGDDAAHARRRCAACRVSARVSMSAIATMLCAHQVIAQRAVRPPVAGDRRFLAHDEAGDLRRRAIRRRRPPRRSCRSAAARHRDDLPGIGRIGQDFLVAGQAGVEHDLAARLAGGARGHAAEPGAVFECEHCVHRQA